MTPNRLTPLVLTLAACSAPFESGEPASREEAATRDAGQRPDDPSGKADAASADASPPADAGSSEADASVDAAPDAATCAPTTCADKHRSCGKTDDGCGATLDCGDCPEAKWCGGGGPGACGSACSCSPDPSCGVATPLRCNCGAAEPAAVGCEFIFVSSQNYWWCCPEVE